MKWNTLDYVCSFPSSLLSMYTFGGHRYNLMEGLEEIEEIFVNRIKPYEERIKALEDSERAKEAEIEKLKQSIVQLNKIIDQLKLNSKPGPAKK